MKLKLFCAAIISTISISTVHANLYVSRDANGNMVFTNVRDSRLNQKQVKADPPRSNTNGHSSRNSYQEFMKRANEGFDRNVNSAAEAMTCGDTDLASDLESATMYYFDHHFDVTNSQRQSLQEKFERNSQTLYSLATMNGKVKKPWPNDLCNSALKRARDNLRRSRERLW